MQKLLKLLNAIEIDHNINNITYHIQKEKYTKKLLSFGIIFSDEIYKHCSDETLDVYYKTIKNLELTGEMLNSGFHKSWHKVKNTEHHTLFIEQLLHYVTTYGAEHLGIYDENNVYFPVEEFNIPEFNDKIILKVIHGYTKDEILCKLLNYVNTGIALSSETINDIVSLLVKYNYDGKDISTIQNRELKIMLCDKLDIVPSNNIEFLRFLLYKTINTTLLIKDKHTIDSIKKCDSTIAKKLFVEYQMDHGLEPLSMIFYRFKPIFLAFKHCNNDVTTLRPIINKIRKLAKKHHKPFVPDMLNDIDSYINKYIKAGDVTDDKLISFINEFKEACSKVNIFRKIRSLNAISYNLQNVESKLYVIRNGKSYIKEYKLDKDKEPYYIALENFLFYNIIEHVNENVKGKNIYFPKDVNYALPTSEKQFVGNIPFGTSFNIPDDLIIGVHWFNKNNDRVDLDLSYNSLNYGKIGWDASYKNKGITFSGDVTSAPKPNGAFEGFCFDNDSEDVGIMSLNNFTFNYLNLNEIDYNIIIANDKPIKFQTNYLIDPNKVIFKVPCRTSKTDKQQTIGLVMNDKDHKMFILTNVSFANKISSRFTTEQLKMLTDYYINFNLATVKLRDILMECKCNTIDGNIFNKGMMQYDIDLSLENVDKTTIINMLIGDKK